LNVAKRQKRRPPEPAIAAQVLDAPDSTVLDLLDNLLNKGVMLNGDITLGVAGIDLIYLRLSSLLCAADRVLPRDSRAPRRKARHRQPGGRK
jgi:gas vesicle structural protein